MTPGVVVVDTGDARLHVEHRGAGEPIVVLHGFTGSARAMAPLTERLEVANRVIVPDLVGHGRSSVPLDRAAYSVDSMVRHVLAVADLAGCATFHLVGYSMGGRIALTLGCRVGHRLRSLTLIGASAGLADAQSRAARRARDERWARRVEADLGAFVDEWMAQPIFADQRRLGHGFLAEARALRLAHDPVGLASSLREAGTGSMAPLHQRLRQCTMPTMLVVGGRDTKYRALAVELTEALPRSTVAVIADAGHAAHVERPDEVASRVREFVSAIDGS